MPEKFAPLPFRIPPGYHGPQRSLVLAGGGMRLAYQAGVLQALQEHNLVFSHADGTSGGIFNLAMLLSGLSVQEMGQKWRSVNIKDFVSYFPLRKYLNPFKLAAFGDADGIRDKVFPQLGINIDKINAEQQLAGTFNVCNYSHKTNIAVPQDSVTLNHLIAGVSLPIFMPAVKINDDWFIDAVWIKDANLTEAIKRGAEEIWLIWAIGNEHEYKSGSFNQYVHMIEMSANGALFAEFDYLNELNGRIQNGDSPYGQKAPIKVHIIKPTYPLPLDTDLYFDKINTTTLIEIGYANAKEYILTQSQHPEPPSNNSTKMESPGIGFSFRIKFHGHLLNQQVFLHLSLFIQHVPSFLKNQQPYYLTASLRLGNQPDTYFGYFGRLKIINSAGTANKIFKFSFNICISGKDYFVEGELNQKPNQTYDKYQPVNLIFYEGKNNQGLLVSTTPFKVAAADQRYFKKSFSFYNTKNWFEKQNIKKALKAYFFSGN